MNNFKAIDVFYVRSNRTIETILVCNEQKERVFFVYNYEGCHFRVFMNILELLNFFGNVFDPEIVYEDEEELDKYLETVVL